jgi:hypothetical protein
VDGADNLFCWRIDGLEGLAVDAFYPLVVDEPAGDERLVLISSRNAG